MRKINIAIPEYTYATREEFKTLRTNIQFCGDDKQVILFTSSLPGEGKTSNAIGLAAAFAEMNKNVLLIDADMRKSMMASRLQVTGADKGLSHFLSGQCAVADAVHPTSLSRLHLMFAGPLVPNPTELLSGNRFASMLESFRKVYDYIIIDAPPLGLVVDAAIIAKQSDGAILVVESEKTKYRLAQEVKGKLEATGCPILGAVLSKVDRKKQKGYYSKYYGKNYKKKGYGEYYGEER